MIGELSILILSQLKIFGILFIKLIIKNNGFKLKKSNNNNKNKK